MAPNLHRLKVLLQSNRRYMTQKTTTLLSIQYPSREGKRCILQQNMHHLHVKLQIIVICTSLTTSSTHINTKDGIRYIVRWYGYTAADDTAKPTKNIPEPFISPYWVHLQCQRRIKRQRHLNCRNRKIKKVEIERERHINK